MPVLGQVPDTIVTLPAAWWVPVTKPEVIERLRLHGIAFETLAAPRKLGLDMVRAHVEGSGLDQASRWAAMKALISEPIVPSELKGL